MVVKVWMGGGGQKFPLQQGFQNLTTTFQAPMSTHVWHEVVVRGGGQKVGLWLSPRRVGQCRVRVGACARCLGELGGAFAFSKKLDNP